jgi:twinkle protein
VTQPAKTKLIRSDKPCPDCGASRGLAEYENGTYCFACNKSTRREGNLQREAETRSVPLLQYKEGLSNHDQPVDHIDILPERGLTRDTLSFYGIKTGFDRTGERVYTDFPYPNGAFKRRYPPKRYKTLGEPETRVVPQLFGMDLFPAGCSKAITVCEGEYDAAAVYQMLGKYPAVSVRSSSSALEDCRANQEYLNSFEKVYICFDGDEPGQKAVERVTELFDPQKVYVVKLSTYVDANEFLVDGAEKEFKHVWWNTQPFVPEGIVSGFDNFADILKAGEPKPGLPLPFPLLSEKTYGLHTGNILLFTALEGVGKTEILRAIEHHILLTTQDNIGVIHCEESKARTLQGYAGLEHNTPVHLPGGTVTVPEQIDALGRLIGKKSPRLHLYQHGDSTDPNVILDRIRFLVTGLDCRWVFLDHITHVVTGVEEDKQRQALDYISTKLGLMVEQLDFGLILVSHVDDHNRTRGSRLVSKVAGTRIHLERDLLNPIEQFRNTTTMTLYKNRFGAVTGPAGQLRFDPETFTMRELGADELLKAEVAPHANH